MRRTLIVDRVFAGLLLLFGLMHAVGSSLAYPFLSSELVWAISATVLAVLLAVLNFVRAGRPADTTLAWICAIGCAVWVVLALAFGVSIGNVFDSRVDLHALVALILALFSVRTITAGARA
jgi:hypothetical protein